MNTEQRLPTEALVEGRRETLMSVYVDDMRASLGRMIMCHMVADTREELFIMADAIGVERKWVQDPHTYREHFDVCLSKRTAAVVAGSIEISQVELGRLIVAKRKKRASI